MSGVGGSLGEKVGQGASADVHAWAPGQVVKLFKQGVPRRVVWHEARMTRAVFAAGLPAPEVFGEVTLEGRFGIVLSRFHGPTLLQLSRTGALSTGQAGTILATLASSVHNTPPPPAVLCLLDWMDASLRGSGDKVPAHIVAGILSLIDRLSPGDGLCHCDLHPGNVIMTAEGPRLVDWLGTVRAPAGLDLAVSHFLLSEIFPERADDPQRPRAINAAVQSEYARLSGMSQAALTAAIEHYLPIVSVFALLGGLWPARREQLIQRVEAALRPEDLRQAGQPVSTPSGSLGEKIGDGATADVHAWAPGQVVKLFKAGVSWQFAWHEARMIRAAFAAGVPAPEVFGQVMLEGRFGIVLTRLEGPTLLQLSRSGALTTGQVGAILATLAIQVHTTPPPAGTLSLRDWMDATLRGSASLLVEHITAGILTLIDRLPPGDGLCHGDLHPGNVIMTADGPRLIDWTYVVRAPAAFDLGVCHMLLSEIAPDLVADPDRPRAVSAAVQSEYARLAGMPPAALTAAMEDYLPIVHTFALLGRAPVPVHRERLIQVVEAALRQP